MLSRTGVWQRFLAATKQFLIFLGHPFFLGLISAINGFLYLTYFIGKLVLTLIKELISIGLRLASIRLTISKKFKSKKTHVIKRVNSQLKTLTSKLITIKKSLPKLPSLSLPSLPQVSLKLPSLRRKRRRGRPRKHPRPASLAWLKQKSLTIFSLAITFSLLFLFGIYLPFLRHLPSPSSLITRNQPLTTKILARDGTVLFKIYQDQNRTPVSLENIPQSLILATIAIEDQSFYNHAGFSYRGILRAISKNVFNDKTYGGSTITQQLVKNALLTPEKTFTRKVRELILAVLVEIRFSKQEILEMYFNEVAYGGTAYGVQAASEMYFNKPVTQLSLAESSLLAGLPAAPTTFSPFGAHPELAKIRQAEVLRRMHEEGFITIQQLETAGTAPLKFTPQTTDIIAPHFVMYIKDLLVKQYGEQTVNQGGLEVITSLDPNIQAVVQAAVTDEIESLARLNITNGSALVTNPRTGEILAMVGSKDYFDFENDGQVNVTLRPRQPGSSIKPVNYAFALQNGFTPATIIPDSPICYRLPGQPAYCPRNYDNNFHGNVSLRSALANSYNVPAVKVLSAGGVQNMIDQGSQMGITTWNDPSRFGLSLTLGGGEVKMIDMAVVFGSLANLGLRVDLSPILKVTDNQGKILEEFECQTPFTQNLTQSPPFPQTAQAAPLKTTCTSTRALSSAAAYQLTNILSDNSARAPAFGFNSVLNVPQHQVAVKTGTTQNLRDNWTIGYTSDFVVTTWVGNNDNSSMSYVASGITGASPIWRKITDFLLRNQPQHVFSTPEDLVAVKVCTLTGQLSCSGCPTKVEYFVPGTEPKHACSAEQIEALKQKAQEEKEKRDQILTGASTEQ